MTNIKTALSVIVAAMSFSAVGLLTQQDAVAKTSKWENLGEGEYVPLTSKTTVPKTIARIWKQQFYMTAKQVNAKSGIQVTYIVKLTKSGKGTYFHHWTGTKAHPYQHLMENDKFGKVYKTKLKGQYAYTPTKGYSKNGDNARVAYVKLTGKRQLEYFSGIVVYDLTR